MSSNPFNRFDFPKNLDNERLYSRWFEVADTDHDGRISGDNAVKFLDRSGLGRAVLGKIWAMADSSRAGYLDRAGFTRAMDLVAVAQQTGEVSAEAYTRLASGGGLKPPKLEGMDALMTQDAAQSSSNPFLDGSGGPSIQIPSPGYHTPNSGAPSPGLASPGMPTPGRKFKNMSDSKRIMTLRECSSIIDGLKVIYFNKIKILEEAYKFGSFFSSYLTEADFQAKPSVLLLGQYSTGKTTFIKHLLGRDYPGINIGPEPTTDRFVVVMGGVEERRTPGNTLIVQPDKPYSGLAEYGNGFLAKFEGASCPSKLLEEISLVDTPGVLSGEKQRIERSYNFIDVCGWFASRCDLILLLFDPYKLDISDEFKAVIGTLKGHDDKVRVVLNKADQVDMQQLMRVYGALMWSLGKVFRTPEVCRVYIGSFNANVPIRSDLNPDGVKLFQKEQADLLQDLYEIPQRSCDRRVNEFVKRVRACKIHCLIIGHLRKQMPSMMGKQKAQEKLLAELPRHFAHVQREYHLPAGDFPDVNRYAQILSAYDLSAFPKLREKDVKALDDTLSVDIPALVKRFENPYA